MKRSLGLGINTIQREILLALREPDSFTSSFVVDTILGQLNWTDTNRGTAQYEVYSSTNGGADVLLATTAAGATSYQDTACKQNASVVYKIRAKKSGEFSDLIAATVLATPLCCKTNQSTLVAAIINILNITAGKTVTLNWGDGTSQAYTGNNTNITNNYGATGLYNIWLTGDTNFITRFQTHSQTHFYGNLTNWILPNVDFLYLHNCNYSGNTSGWVFGTSLLVVYLFGNLFTGAPPAMTAQNEANDTNFSVSTNNYADCINTVFRKKMTVFNISSQKVAFSTANIDKVLKALADWYQNNAPTGNCTFTMNGANMGIPTDGASNADITRLVGYYTAASKTATVVVRTS